MAKKILVAVDMSKISEAVFAYGCSLALRLNDDVTFIHVTPHPTLWRGYEQWLPAELNQEIEELRARNSNTTIAKHLKTCPLSAVRDTNSSSGKEIRPIPSSNTRRNIPSILS